MSDPNKQVSDSFLQLSKFTDWKKFRKKPTIVIIDDDEAVTKKIYQPLLERQGYHVLTAKDGPSGLDLLKNERSYPEIVFVDCSMPRMDGATFLQELKKILPNIFSKSRIIGLTSYDSCSPSFQKIKALAFDCREKPFDINGILRMASDYLESPSAVGT